MIDLDHLRSWIGRTETAEDVLSPRIAAGLRATVGSSDARGNEAPAGIQWCLFVPETPTRELGQDGHPPRGGFLPPVPLPRRMWAGGKLEIGDALQIGDRVRRTSRIADVTAKSGRSGDLCFVTVEHEYATDRGTAITERQDIVYRGAEGSTPAAPAPAAEELPVAEWWHEVPADPVLLFRYSAMTFNSHRIHYDRDYAVREEGYAGLVVHGPLQATLLLDLAAKVLGRLPRTFSFRGMRPLIDGQSFRVCAARVDEGLTLWTAGADGSRAMTGQAS